MINVLFFIICFLASTIGAICGIGGGVIIKPVLDAFNVLSVSTISFLSGITVLSMSTYSVVKNKLSGGTQIEKKTGLPLAIGAALGGIVGKVLFDIVKNSSSNPEKVGSVQAVCLAIVTVGTLIYTINKARIHTKQTSSSVACLILGLFLGIMSSFLGIGGGPINLVVLYYFFSMPTKVAGQNSLYMIFFSQLANLIFTICSGKVPEFSIFLLVLMACGGIAGGIVGRKINKKIADKTVDKLFIGLMSVIILISIYNAVRLA